MSDIERNTRKSVEGVVVSDKMAKTVKVKSERMVKHPRFHKYVKRSTTYTAHDENSEARIGDFVELMETRPMSKTKRYRLVRVIRRGKGHAPVVDQGGES